MKKIMLTLCTLLAVNAGSTMYAGGRVVDGKVDTEVKDPTGKSEKSGTAGKRENGPTTGQKNSMSKQPSNSSGSKPNGANSASTSSSSSLVTDLGIDLNEVQKKSTKLTELNETKKNALTGSVIHQNLNIIKEMNGGKTSLIEPSAESKYAPKDFHDQTFNLDTPSKGYGVSEEMNVKFSRGSSKGSGKPIESTRTSKIQKGKDKYETTTTKTTYNQDGSMIDTVFKDNPNYNEKAAKEAKLSQKTPRPFKYDVQKTIASHSIKYNTDGSVNINRLDANGESIESKSLTKEEARQEIQEKVTDKKSSMTDEQTAEAQRKADQAGENAEAAKENKQTRQDLVDKAAEEASNALENNDEPGVQTAVQGAVEAVVGDRMRAEQKATMIEQITAKIMEIGKAGKQALTATIESIRSVFNSFFDLAATTQFRTSAPQADFQETNTSSESALFNNGVKKYEDYGDAPRSESPTAVADASSLRESEVRPQFNQYAQPKPVR